MDYIRDLIGEMPLVISPEQLAKWKAGELIQRTMPNLTPAERELLIGTKPHTPAFRHGFIFPA